MKEVALGELGTWTGGGTPKKSIPAYWRGEIPWISPKDMKSIRLEDTQNHITELAVKESAAKIFPAQSIAFVVRSGILEHTLPIALIPFPAAANQDIKILTPKPEVNPEWLLYALLGLAGDIRTSCRKHGTTVASIEFPKLNAYSVTVPPKPDQDRLVAETVARLSLIESGLNDLATAKDRVQHLRRAVLRAAAGGSAAGNGGAGKS